VGHSTVLGTCSESIVSSIVFPARLGIDARCCMLPFPIDASPQFSSAFRRTRI